MAFTRHNIGNVQSLCADVVKLCHEVTDEYDRLSWEWHERFPETFDGDYDMPVHPGSPLSASLRRRSMDLTRALAQLRK